MLYVCRSRPTNTPLSKKFFFQIDFRQNNNFVVAIIPIRKFARGMTMKRRDIHGGQSKFGEAATATLTGVIKEK